MIAAEQTNKQAKALPRGPRENLPRFGIAAGLLAATGLLMLLFSQFGPAFFPAYRTLSKGLMDLLAACTGLIPFAIWDLLAIPLAVLLVGSFAWTLARKRSLWRWLANTCLVMASLIFFLVGGWGLNHYAPPLANELGLEVRQYSGDELADATIYYLERAAGSALQVPRDADASLARQDFQELASIAGASYAKLGVDYPLFRGSTAPVKELTLAGEPLLYWGATGIFWPFTAESSVPANCGVANMPYTMCHEVAHRLGIASEQEANFAAYLACSRSSDPRFVYAANFEAFGYCFNQLAANHPDKASLVVERLVGTEAKPGDLRAIGVSLVFEDRQSNYEHYQAYEGPVEDIGTAANDAYLRSFSQQDGVQSYGQVVDYLIAWSQSH